MEENINLFRNEKRLILPAVSVNDATNLIAKMGLVSASYPDSPVTQTVYLLDDEQTWSLGASLKARCFKQTHSQEILMRDINNRTYRFEIKRELGTDVREKEQRNFKNLESVVKWANEIFPEIRPYLVVEYKRQHFVPRDSSEWCRITLDTEMRFWFFPPGEFKAVCIKNFDPLESSARLEIKICPARIFDSQIQTFLGNLEKIGAQPVISKKQAGLNAVKAWFDKRYSSPLVKELENCEIEAKLTVVSEIDPNIFFADLKEFCRTETRPIALDPHYPFTFTTSSVNHYWSRGAEEGGLSEEGLKILSREITARPVFKSNTREINSGLGILERSEIKGRPFSVWETSFKKIVQQEEPRLGRLKYAGFLLRRRKAIWLLNESSGRIYHISLDKCTAHGKSCLYQIEIEYSGMLERKQSIPLKHREVREKIVQETKFLAEKIIEFAQKRGVILTPGKEKFKWLTE